MKKPTGKLRGNQTAATKRARRLRRKAKLRKLLLDHESTALKNLRDELAQANRLLAAQRATQAASTHLNLEAPK